MKKPAGVALDKNFSVRVDYCGAEAEPVLVIDNFLAHAQTLVDYAARFSRFSAADAFYPGVRSPAPDAYIAAIRVHLGEIIYQTFGLLENNIVGVETDFSMVLTPPAKLKPLQRIPHYDSNKRSELAAVHFLCSSEHGGTGFYRHRTTGYEYVDQLRVEKYKQSVEQDVKQQGPLPARYMNGDTALFERIASYDAVFNRMLIYRCTSLHSGNIAEDFSFDPDPRTGRLSLNTFIFCRQ